MSGRILALFAVAAVFIGLVVTVIVLAVRKDPKTTPNPSPYPPRYPGAQQPSSAPPQPGNTVGGSPNTNVTPVSPPVVNNASALLIESNKAITTGSWNADVKKCGDLDGTMTLDLWCNNKSTGDVGNFSTVCKKYCKLKGIDKINIAGQKVITDMGSWFPKTWKTGVSESGVSASDYYKSRSVGKCSGLNNMKNYEVFCPKSLAEKNSKEGDGQGSFRIDCYDYCKLIRDEKG
jgi:hypothetical protein